MALLGNKGEYLTNSQYYVKICPYDLSLYYLSYENYNNFDSSKSCSSNFVCGPYAFVKNLPRQTFIPYAVPAAAELFSIGKYLFISNLDSLESRC